MKDNELEQLIHDLTIKFGNGSTFKKKLSIVLKELLKRTQELDSRCPEIRPVGRPRKGEEEK